MMKNVSFPGLILLFLIITNCGCSVTTIYHDEELAIAEANSFIKTYYLEEAPDKAFQMLDFEVRKTLTIGNLKDVLLTLVAKVGKAKRFTFDSFEPMPGQKAMTLYYECEHEKGKTFHKLVLLGDVSSGYAVGGTFFKLVPYPKNKLNKTLEKEYIIEIPEEDQKAPQISLGSSAEI
jgi:hypothetical protein